MPDYDEVKAAYQRQGARSSPDLTAAEARMRALHRQAAERMEQLLRGDEWDAFKTLVQGFIDDAEHALAQQREMIEGGRVVGDALMAAINAARDSRVQIDAYQRVLALPQAIINAAEAKTA